MLTTLELRWFIGGTLPVEVEQWFRTNCPGTLLGLPEAREDRYLCIPECEYLNLKLRQGKLELKWCQAELGVYQFGECWQGKVEQWTKWSCEGVDIHRSLPADALRKKPWVGIKKVRSQRLYHNIAIELTQLQVSNEHWWSVAFEMAEGNIEQLESFLGVVGEVSQTYQKLALSAENSCAYPSWLLRIFTNDKNNFN